MIRVFVPHQISPRLPPSAPVRTFSGRSMGCDWSVRCAGIADGEALRGAVQARLDDLVMLFSTWQPDSLVSRFNAAPAGAVFDVPVDFSQVLKCALQVAAASDGACDVSAGELVRLWGFGATNRYDQSGFAPPSPSRIDAALACSGWQRLQFDGRTRHIVQPGGLSLDFSAIAKGYAVDAVSRLLHSAGLPHHLIDIGGELRGCGMKPDGQPWWVEIEQPDASSCGSLPRVRIALHELSVATSGDYLRSYLYDGARVSHCIDARTGRPVGNGIASVTVLHSDCMWADAWSTACMVLGVEAALTLADRRQLAVRLVRRESSGCVEFHSAEFAALEAAQARR